MILLIVIAAFIRKIILNSLTHPLYGICELCVDHTVALPSEAFPIANFHNFDLRTVKMITQWNFFTLRLAKGCHITVDAIIFKAKISLVASCYVYL